MADITDVQTAVDELSATNVDSNSAADALVDAYALVPQRIAEAVAAAQAKGATPAQLASFTALNDSFKAEAAKMRAALNAPPTEEPPVL